MSGDHLRDFGGLRLVGHLTPDEKRRDKKGKREREQRAFEADSKGCAIALWANVFLSGFDGTITASTYASIEFGLRCGEQRVMANHVLPDYEHGIPAPVR